MGLEWDEDGVGPPIGSTMGNILCRVPGRSGEGTPIFLCAHLDTVPPGRPDRAGDRGRNRPERRRHDPGCRRQGRRRRHARGRSAHRRGEARPHAGIELLFTPKEEVGLVGAYAFDHTRLEARSGTSTTRPRRSARSSSVRRPRRRSTARFHGRAAHAGMYPEDGRSAIFAAARAVADMRLGRIDHQSSANVGVITGGTARNIVPEWCSFEAEARSRDPKTLADPVQEMLDAIGFAASTSDCTAETEIEDTYRGYTFAEDEPAVRLRRRGASPGGLRADDGVLGRRRRRERLQRAGPPVRESRATGWPTSTRRTSASRSQTSKAWSR